MPCTCLVINCKSRGKRDNVGFFAVPTVLNHKFATHKNELTKLRREKWIAAIKRPDILNLIKYQRVCGRHFISGRPADLEEVDHPDWVPTQNLGHNSGAFQRKPISLARYQRFVKRKKKKETLSFPTKNLNAVPFVEIFNVPEGIVEDNCNTPTVKIEDPIAVLKEENSPIVCDSPPKIPQYQDSCRACFNKVDTTFNIFEYMLQDENLLIAEALRTVLPPKIVQEDDKLPQQICADCLIELSQAYAFIKKCLQTHETLMLSLNPSENQKVNETVAEESNTIISEEIVVKEDNEEVQLKTEENTIAVPKEDSKEENVAVFSCEICKNETFSKNEDLVKHSLNVHEEYAKPYKCDKCEKRFALEANWARHQVVHTSKEYENCSRKPKKRVNVDQEAKRMEKLSEMIDLYISQGPSIEWFMCEQCGKEYTCETDLNHHLSTSHASLLSQPKQTQNSQPKTVVNHNQNSKHVVTFLCEDCGRVLKSKKAYQQHQHCHTGLKPHQCEQCGKTFTQLSTLNHHRYTHTGEKPYSCDICKRTFRQWSHLRAHRRIHTGEKPFNCSLCGKKFAWKMNLNTHMRIHTGQKPFSCGECNEEFMTVTGRKKHLIKCHVDAFNMERDQEVKTPTVMEQFECLL